MERYCLDGLWSLTYFPQGAHPAARPSELTGELPTIPAQVPGNVELDLCRAGVLPEDLFFGENIRLLRAYEGHEWWYRRAFTLPNLAPGQRLLLRLEGVDCLAEYFLNDQPIGRSDNMLIPHKLELPASLLLPGENQLAVRLRSPLREALAQDYPPTLLLGGDRMITECLFVRKAAHSYGWDIMPRALSAGLWRSVSLEVQDPARIEQVYIATRAADENHAELAVTYQLALPYDMLGRAVLTLSGRCGDSRFEAAERLRFAAGALDVSVPRPALWWPAGYGGQPLYEVTAALTLDGRELDRRSWRVGIRTLELDRTESNLEQGGRFQFRVNGVDIQVRGSNWVPADVFHSRDAARYEAMLDLFSDLQCNMVRCWGGNVYEDDAFFDSCDRRGLLVWQDFAMACALPPQSDAFAAVLEAEATAIVRKLRNHPSLALWAGDNEVDQFMAWRGLDPAANRITRQVLPRVTALQDPYRPYLPSSPYISPEARAAGAPAMPENHLWGPRDYFKSPFYTDRCAHFVSEIGYHGCPNVSTIRRFIDPEHLWPCLPNPQWRLHATDDFDTRARIELMADQVGELFGRAPDNLEDFALASQISQAEAKKFFIETSRRLKPRRTGILWWNVIDGWPQFSDAVVDHDFGRKLAYYYIRRAQQPLCLFCSEPEDWHITLLAGNDSRDSRTGTYTVTDADSGQELLAGAFALSPGENRALGRIRVCQSDHRLLLIRWESGGAAGGNHYLLGHPPFDLETYRRHLTAIAALPLGFDPEAVAR